MTKCVYLADEAAMVEFGGKLGQLAEGGEVIFLEGDLGMGKTTLSRGMLRGFGHQGSVKSPTYTLVEPYEVADRTIYHFDLYRLGDPEELEYLGIRDYFSDQAVCLIEWPDRGAGVLPECDFLLTITLQDRGRRINWQVNTEKGQRLADKLEQTLPESA